MQSLTIENESRGNQGVYMADNRGGFMMGLNWHTKVESSGRLGMRCTKARPLFTPRGHVVPRGLPRVG